MPVTVFVKAHPLRGIEGNIIRGIFDAKKPGSSTSENLPRSDLSVPLGDEGGRIYGQRVPLLIPLQSHSCESGSAWKSDEVSAITTSICPTRERDRIQRQRAGDAPENWGISPECNAGVPRRGAFDICAREPNKRWHLRDDKHDRRIEEGRKRDE